MMNRTLPPLLILLPVVLAPLAAGSSDQGSQEIAAQVAAEGGVVEFDDRGHIVGVFLGNTWVTDADLAPLASLRDLRRLDLSLTYVSDRGLEILKSLEKLEELNLFAAEFITDTAISYLRGHPNLRKLNLRGTDITDTSLRYIAELPALRSLDVSFTLISEVGLESLDTLVQLEELVVGANEIKGVGLNALRLLASLRTLSLSGVQMRNGARCWAVVVGEPELETIGTLTRLETLNLGWGLGSGAARPDLGRGVGGSGGSNCRVRDGGIKVTNSGLQKLTTLNRLQSLDLSGSEITSEGLATALPAWRELRRLNLWNVQGIDDTIARHLEELEGLEMLDLSRTALTDEGLMELANNASLHRLYVSRTNVTAAGVAAFREANPSCWISWDGNVGAGLGHGQRKEAGE